jgi:hypothetical protein
MLLQLISLKKIGNPLNTPFNAFLEIPVYCLAIPAGFKTVAWLNQILLSAVH